MFFDQELPGLVLQCRKRNVEQRVLRNEHHGACIVNRQLIFDGLNENAMQSSQAGKGHWTVMRSSGNAADVTFGSSSSSADRAARVENQLVQRLFDIL